MDISNLVVSINKSFRLANKISKQIIISHLEKFCKNYFYKNSVGSDASSIAWKRIYRHTLLDWSTDKLNLNKLLFIDYINDDRFSYIHRFINLFNESSKSLNFNSLAILTDIEKFLLDINLIQESNPLQQFNPKFEFSLP